MDLRRRVAEASLSPTETPIDTTDTGNRAVRIFEDTLLSNTVSVEIMWSAMTFVYHEREWNPDTHSYIPEGWTTDGGVLTFRNANDLGIVGKFYALDSEGAYAELAASTLPLASAEGTTLLGAPCSNAYFSISGEDMSYDGTIGIILVTISPQSRS